MLKTAAVTPWKGKTKRVRIKQFFWKDKTGRGFTGTLTQTQVKRNFLGERSWQGVSAYRYGLDAEIGDEWENSTSKIVRVG